MSALLGWVLWLGAAPSEPVASEAAQVRTVAVDRVVVEVDHAPLLAQQMPAAAEKSGRFVHQDVTRALRERHAVDVVDGDGAPGILVRLAWKDYAGSVYAIDVSTRRPGEEPRLVESFEAFCVNNSALADAVVGRLPAALEQLARSQQTAWPEPVVEVPTADSGEPRAVEGSHADCSERMPLTPMGKAGVGLLAAGAVGAITGGFVFVQQRRLHDDDPSLLDWQGRDYRPAGTAVMVASGAVAVAGAVLLVTARARARRARRAAKPAAWLLPTPRGVVVTGRF